MVVLGQFWVEFGELGGVVPCLNIMLQQNELAIEPHFPLRVAH